MTIHVTYLSVQHIYCKDATSTHVMIAFYKRHCDICSLHYVLYNVNKCNVDLFDVHQTQRCISAYRDAYRDIITMGMRALSLRFARMSTYIHACKHRRVIQRKYSANDESRFQTTFIVRY